MENLTAFQRDILYIAAGLETPYGLAIKRGLEAYYGTEVNHGRLYPNLDTLVGMGLIEKSSIDKRTNRYVLTGRGREVIDERREWEIAQLESHASSDGSNHVPA
jgi:DNA-binding PadR family transcriptional regulator